MTISLRDITKDNYRQVLDLQVAPGQENFVASNPYSLAQAYVYRDRDLTPLAIYDDETPVGFMMHGVGTDGRYWIYRLMIAEPPQRRGYGRAAMQALLGQFREADKLGEVFISYEPENGVARKLYARLGFVETGEVVEGETVARLSLKVSY